VEDKVATGQLLVQRGVITAEALDRALALRVAQGGRLFSWLLETKACTERDLVLVLSEKMGLPGVDFSRTTLPLDLLDLVPRPVSEHDEMLPLSTSGGRLHLAMSTPVGNERVLDEVRFVTGLSVSPYVAVRSALLNAITGCWAAKDRGDIFWRGPLVAPNAVAELSTVHPPPPAVPGGSDEVEILVLDEEAEGFDVLEDEPLATSPSGPQILVGGDESMEEVVGTPVRAGATRILVVDDEPEIRTLLEKMLSAKGYDVMLAADGKQALEMVARGPDLVLLDAMLPYVHGFEICRRIRQDPKTRSLPVIMMTAIYRGWRFAQDAREAYGANDYVEKPFHLDDLSRRIEQALQSQPREDTGKSEGAVFYQQGMDLFAQGKLEAARDAFAKAIAGAPYSAKCHYQLARSLRALGDDFTAMTEYEQAVELQGSLFPALHALSQLYMEKGFRRKAAETLERAAQVAPDSATKAKLRSDLMKLI
jgi:CheY-like chemotaxis protein